MTKFKVLFLAGLLSVAAGCSDDDGGGIGGGGNGAEGPAGVEGDLIDRNGRPGVSTALVSTFSADQAQKDQSKNNFNEVGFQGSGEFADEIASSLAIYDSLAGTCGDNPLTATGTGAGTYSAFASALAQDQLLVNGDSTNCNQYLGVELGMTNSCGGRTPQMDVIDTTYSALAAGQTSGISDGVSSDDQSHPRSFPYLAGPSSGD